MNNIRFLYDNDADDAALPVNVLVNSDSLNNASYLTGVGLGGFFTVTASTAIARPDGGTGSVAKFVATAAPAQLFARQSGLSMAAGAWLGSIYIYVPTQGGVVNWSFQNDFADIDIGSPQLSTLFDQWVRVSSAATLAALRAAVDFNILRNGGVPTVGFTFYAACGQVESGATLNSYNPTDVDAPSMSNLLTDVKGDIFRTIGTQLVITLTFAELMLLNMFKFVFCNFSSTATMQIDGYTNAGDLVPLITVGPSLCCGYTELENVEFGEPLGVNAWSYCGGAYAGLYFDAMMVRQIKVTVVDADNEFGWLDISRALTGNYYEPASNPDWNPKLSIQRGGELHRSADGTLRSERKPMARALAIDLKWLLSAFDRTKVYNIFAGNGAGTPVFASLFPENEDDLLLEQQHEIYGRLGVDNSLSNPEFGRFAAPMEVKEI